MQLSQGQNRQPLSPEEAPPPCVCGSGMLLVNNRLVANYMRRLSLHQGNYCNLLCYGQRGYKSGGGALISTFSTAGMGRTYFDSLPRGAYNTALGSSGSMENRRGGRRFAKERKAR